MVVGAEPRQLFGRQREHAVLDRVLEAARDGHGGVLAVYGEPGVGKTALLESAIEARADFRVARTVGVEGEMELAFAALQQLCAPSLDLQEHLPQHQREAMEVALGLSAGRPPNPFLVGLAVLNLLSEAAEQQPPSVARQPRKPPLEALLDPSRERQRPGQPEASRELRGCQAARKL